MRSAPAGSSVNAQGLTIANGIPLSRMRSSPYKSINCYTTTQGFIRTKNKSKQSLWSVHSQATSYSTPKPSTVQFFYSLQLHEVSNWKIQGFRLWTHVKANLCNLSNCLSLFYSIFFQIKHNFALLVIPINLMTVQNFIWSSFRYMTLFSSLFQHLSLNDLSFSYP